MTFDYNVLKNKNLPNDIGLEAIAYMKSKVIKVQKQDYMLTPKAGDLITVFPIGMDEESALDLFSDISTKKNKMKAIRFKGYYLKPYIKETIGAKRVLVNTKKIYRELTKTKKEYGITTISTKPGTFKSMSYMANLSYLMDGIKAKTFDSGLLMNTKLRANILETIKKNILDSSTPDRDKVIYFKGPFLANTGVGLTIVDAKLQKIWSPVVLFLEWLYNDEEGFKTWMRENKVNIVFDNGVGENLILSRSEMYQKLPMYNFKYIMRVLHRLDGSNLAELGLTEEEIKEVEETISNASTTVDEMEVLSKEELFEIEKQLEDTEDIEDAVNGPDDDILEEFMDIEESEDDLKDEKSAVITKEAMANLFEEVPEEDRPTQIVELHNYTALKKDIETPSVAKLRKRMVKNYGMDLKEVVKNIANHKIEVAKFNNVVDNDYNKSSFILLDKSYQDKLSDVDLITALTAPAELSIPLFLESYEKIDISDREFRGYLLKAKYLTHQGDPLEFEMEVPVVDNNSIFVGASSKYLTNQDMSKPIKKEDMNVIITMAYNKTILSIKGKYATAFDKMLVKTIYNFANENDAIKVKTTEELSDFIYDNRMSYRMIHLNKHFGGIRYKNNGYDIDFDFRGKVKEEGGTNCGYVNAATIMHDPATETFWFKGQEDTKYDTTEFIMHALELIDIDLLNKSKVKRLDNLNFVNGCYCNIMSRELPIVLVMLVETPLKDLLERLKKENDLDYSIVSNDKLELSKLKNDHEYGYIKLSDYTIRIKYNNVVNQLILVPLVNMDLSMYSVFDIAHILKDLVGSDNTSIYLENFATSFISGGDKRVLQMFNMPSDFTGVFIYAACLFHDYKTYYSSDATNYRLITPTEVINRMVYEIINKEFSSNTARTKRGSRQAIKIPRDSVIRSLQTTMANISEDSNISPFRSIMLKSSKSQKGHMGVNMSRAYNMKRRMFNENNLGTETFATAYSGQAGIVKYLPFNPKFADLTGAYLNQNTPDGLDPSNMMTFIDSYVPYLTRDDSPRRIMTNGQFNHVIAVKDADPMLVSTGADEAALYMCPEFSYIAKGEGEVVTINDMFVTIKYKDPELGTVTYRLDNVERNSAKGYFMKNDFVVDHKLKVGKRIKKGAVIAYNKNFFKKKANGAIALAAGPLVATLICDGEGTWEDSVALSRNLSNRMSTPLIKRMAVKFDMSSVDILDVNLGLGDHVDPDTELIKYNNLSEDATLNDFFSNVEGINTHSLEAHYKGTLNDITVYYRTSKQITMTKSIKQFLRDVEIVQNNKNHMKSLDNDSSKFNIANKTSKPQQLTRGKFSKINGDVIENGEILIEFNIEVEDRVGPSDKLVIDRALKGEPSFVIKDEDRPYGALTGRTVDLMIDTQSVNARKTPGLALHGDLVAILLHTAIKNRMILNRPPEKGSLLDYKSSHDMVEGKLKYKGE